MSEPYTEHFGRILILVQYVNAAHLEYDLFFGFFFALIFSRTFSVARIFCFFVFFPRTPPPHPPPPITFLTVRPLVNKILI